MVDFSVPFSATFPSAFEDRIADRVPYALPQVSGTSDYSAIFQTAIDFCAVNDCSLYVPPGAYTLDNITLRSGVSIVGDNMRSVTFLALSGSTNPMFKLPTGPLVNCTYKGFRINGAGGGAGQNAFYFYCQAQATAPFHGGLWFFAMQDIEIFGFDGHAIWFRGGADGVLLPVQFGTMDRVFITRANNSTSRCVLMTGQVNQISVNGGQWDGQNIGTGTSVEISREYTNGSVIGGASVGGTPGTQYPENIKFNVLTSQEGERAIDIERGGDTSIDTCWFENLYRPIRTSASSVGVSVVNCHFANAGSDGAGGGYLIRGDVSTKGRARNNNVVGSVDKLYYGDQHSGWDMAHAFTGTNVFTAPYTGLSRAFSISSNTLTSRSCYQVHLNSAALIKTISSTLLPGERFSITANADGITFDATGNLYVGRWSLLTLNNKDTATFERNDAFNRWLLVGTTGVLS